MPGDGPGDAGRLGWHTVADPTAGLGYRDFRRPRTGERLEMLVAGRPARQDERPALCRRGMHADASPAGARRWRRDGRSRLCLVLVQGTGPAPGASRMARGDEKFVGRSRTVLASWSWDHVDRILREELRAPRWSSGGTTAWGRAERRLLASAFGLRGAGRSGRRT